MVVDQIGSPCLTSESVDPSIGDGHGEECPGVDHVQRVRLVPVLTLHHLLAGLVVLA